MSSPTWFGPDPAPDPVPLRAAGWIRAGLRGTLLLLVLLAGLLVKLPLRGLEWLIWRRRRPFSPRVTQAICRMGLRALGIRLQMRGRPLRGPGAMVANHGSWLDILALNAKCSVCFVAKSEVRDWPGIGALARLAGTLFIARDRRAAPDQARIFGERLALGHRLLFFPEGTSSDGLRVLPFKTSLFAAFLAEGVPADMRLQAVTVTWHAPRGADPRFYAWWGDMALGPHLLQVLSARRQGRVEVTYHRPVLASAFSDRKALAAFLEAQVRDGHAPLRRRR